MKVICWPAGGERMLLVQWFKAQQCFDLLVHSPVTRAVRRADQGVGGAPPPNQPTTITNKERALRTRDPRTGGACVVDGWHNAWRRRAPGPHGCRRPEDGGV